MMARAMRWHLLLLCICSIAGALSAYRVLRLHADTSLQAMFSQDDPAARAMSRVLNDFSAVEELLVLATTPSGEPAEQQLTAYAHRLERAVTTDPEASQLATGVFWHADAQQKAFFENVLFPNAIFYLDDASFNAARERLTRDGMVSQLRKDEALISSPGPTGGALSKAILKDPLRLHEFILSRITDALPFKTYNNSDAFLSPDGHSILIRIQGRASVSDLDFCQSLTQSIQRLASRVNDDHLEVHLSGAYAIAAASQSAIRADMIETVVTSVVLLQALFVVAFRRPFRSFLLALAPVAMGILYGLGFYSIFKSSITPITAVIGGILAGMAIDYSIQFLAHYDRNRDAAQTLARLWPAIGAAFVTSVIGFLAIGSSNVKALRDFSLLGSLALAGAFLCTLTLLPALLAIFPPRAIATSKSLFRLKADSLMRVIANRPVIPLLLAIGLLTTSVIVVALSGDRLPMESDLSTMHPRPNPALDAQDLITTRMGMSPGAMIIYFHATAPSQLVALAHKVTDRLSNPDLRAAGIAGTYSLATLLPDLSRASQRVAATGPQFAHRVTSDFQNVVSESIFDPANYQSYTQFLNRLLTQRQVPQIDDLKKYPSLARTLLPKSAETSTPMESIMLVFLDTPTEQRAARDRAVSAVRAAIADTPEATLTGLSVLAHDAEQNIHQQLPRLIIFAFALVALYLLIHFHNLQNFLLAVCHTGFSLICLLAFMRFSGQKLNMMNLVAFPLLIGIDVDYAIFLITSVRARNRMEPAQLLDHLSTNATAVILCATATFLGFGSLVTTRVPAIRSMGIIVAAGIVCSMLASFCFITPLVVVLSRRSSPSCKSSSL